MKIQNGLIASLAIQCVNPDTGETGCFLFSGESHRNPGSAKTPVFPDLLNLFTALPALGWSPVGDRYVYSDKGAAIEAYMATRHPNAI